MICENCSKEHEGTYGSGRFCSVKCSRGFSTKSKRKEINEAVRKKMTHTPIIKICKWCHKEFTITHKKHQITCSKSCSAKLKSNEPESVARITKMFSDLAISRYAKNDITIGWQTRPKKLMSRPERIVDEILKRNNINFINELKVGKWFIDFALNNQIALEIDGKQHELPERKAKDNLKDAFLKQAGWNVIRIKWKEHNIETEILKKINEVTSSNLV